MARHRHLRAKVPSTRTLRRAGRARLRKSTPKAIARLKTANRKALLLGTALASTLLLSSLIVPTPAAAQQTCVSGVDVPPVPAPIELIGIDDSIDCENNEARTDQDDGRHDQPNDHQQ